MLASAVIDKNRPRRKSGGLSLVEVLITLFILMLVLGLSYQGLQTMLQTQAQVPADIARWSDIERFFDRLESDFTHLSWQSPVGPTGHRFAPLTVDPNLSHGAQAPLMLSRFSADRNFLLAGNTYTSGQWVGYRLREGTIELLMFPQLYLPLDARFNQPEAYPVLAEVERFSVEVLAINTTNWASVYPANTTENNSAVTIEPPPRAIKVTLKCRDLNDELVRIFDRIY